MEIKKERGGSEDRREGGWIEWEATRGCWEEQEKVEDSQKTKDNRES